MLLSVILSSQDLVLILEKQANISDIMHQELAVMLRNHLTYVAPFPTVSDGKETEYLLSLISGAKV